MCAAVHCDSIGKKIKSKSKLGVFNRIISAVKAPMLTTDAAPIDDPQIPSNAIQSRNENLPTPTPLDIPNRNAHLQHTYPMQMVQNNMNQSNQNGTVIGTQQNLSFTDCNGLQFGNTYHLHPRKNSHSSSSSRKNSLNDNNQNQLKRMTRTVVDMMESKDFIDVPIMRVASRYMDKDWRMAFRGLGITDPEISQYIEQYFHISVKEVKYQLLLLWKRNSDDPTLGKLSTVLWKNEEYECINNLKILYKQKRSQNPTEQTTEKPKTAN